MNKNYLTFFLYTVFLFIGISVFSVKKLFSYNKAIIIGATSGIGRALAKKLSREGCVVGLTGRRTHLLESLKQELPEKSYIHYMDVSDLERAQKILQKMIKKMGVVDLIIINAGTASLNIDNWQEQKETILVNVLGFAALAHTAMQHFYEQGRGHLVGISSIAALRGVSHAPIYSASKAFVSNYLDGLRAYVKRINPQITITTIEPGAVDTAMGESVDFWRASPEKAAEQIYTALEGKSEHAYITHRWRLIAWFFKLMPDFIFYNFF